MNIAKLLNKYNSLFNLIKLGKTYLNHAHNLKVVGSNPTPATKEINELATLS